MNTTPNLGLKKPLQTEFYNVDDFNYNSDTIDQAIHDLSENKQNKLSTSQMDAVNSGITQAKVSKLDALPTASELAEEIENAGSAKIKSVAGWGVDTGLPYNFYSGSAVVLNNEIHILGSNSSGNGTKHYKWNGSQWVSVSTLPYDFYFGSAVVLDGEIHILGSNSSGNGTKHYKWNGSQWVSASTLPYDFYFGSAVVLDGEIHILGGNGHVDKHYKWNGNQWVQALWLPYNFEGGSAVVYNNEIHILGGDHNSTAHYKFDGSQWVSASTLPYSFGGSSAVAYNNEIHMLGGYSSANRTKHYKWDGSQWVSALTLPYSFFNGSAVVYNNGIHILGGGSNEENVNHYTFSSLTNHLFVNDQPVNAENILTGEQVSAVNSGITSAKVAKLDNIPTTTELTATLPAGQTTLTFTDSAITANTIVDNVVSSLKGLCYEDIEISEGVLRMTFDKQAVNVSVKVVIR